MWSKGNHLRSEVGIFSFLVECRQSYCWLKIAHVDCDPSSHKYLILCFFTCHLCHFSPIWADAICYLIYLMPVSSFRWVLSLMLFNCSALLYAERAPVNFVPCHYMITLNSWTSDCNFFPQGRTLSLWAYCNDWECDTLFLLNVGIWPYFCLCYVCPYRGSALLWYSKEKMKPSCQLSRAAFSPSASDHYSPLNQTKPESVILSFLLAFFFFTF